MIVKNSFYFSVVTSFFIQILIKFIGMFYNIFLTNNPNYLDVGNGIFMSAHQIYIIFLTISIVGIPSAISKYIAQKSEYDIKKIVNVSVMFWGLIGILEMFVLIFCAKWIANQILNVKISEDILKILSTGIPFVNMNAVYRGVLSGAGKNETGTFIQFLEQFIKVMFTICGIYCLKLDDMEKILYIVSLGISYSVMITTFIYMNKCRKIMNNKGKDIKIIEIVKSIFMYSIPITIIGFFGTVNKNIDMISMMQLLKGVFSTEKINELYGIIISKVDVLINFPIGLNTAVTIPLLSKISYLYSKKDFIEIKKILGKSVEISFGFAIPICLIYIFYSKEILNLLYPNANSGALLLSLSSVLILLNVYLQIIMVYYNGIGKEIKIIIVFFIGAIIKLILNILLIPRIYEKGIILSSIISDALIIYMLKIKFEFKYKDNLYESLKMIFLIFIVKNILKIFVLNEKFIFIISLRSRVFCMFFTKNLQNMA